MRGTVRHWRVTRDTVLVTFALTAGAYEIVLGGARASVLTFCIALLASPLVTRVDEARRKNDKP